MEKQPIKCDQCHHKPFASPQALGRHKSHSHSATAKQPVKLSDHQALYAKLDKRIRDIAAPVPVTIKKLTPLLAQMEQLLSQKRGWGSGMTGLPRWTPYLKNIAEEFDLSVRTIQRRLHEFRGENEQHPKRGKTNKDRGIPPQLAPSDRRSLVQNAIATSDYLEAMERKEQPLKPYLNALKRTAIGPERIQALMAGQPDPRDKAWDAFMLSVLKYTRVLEQWVYDAGAENMKTAMIRRREEFRASVPAELKPVYDGALYIVSTGKKPIPFLMPTEESSSRQSPA